MIGAEFGACFAALSTLFTRQHYILDVVAGIGLAWLADVIFLRSVPPVEDSAIERQVAPALALLVLGIVGVGLAGSWLLYRLGVAA